jgi:hypothetical protein
MDSPPLKANKANTLPYSLMDLTVSPKVKIVEGEGVGVRSLAHNMLGVKGMFELQDGLRRLTSKLITHTNVHK